MKLLMKSKKVLNPRENECLTKGRGGCRWEGGGGDGGVEKGSCLRLATGVGGGEGAEVLWQCSLGGGGGRVCVEGGGGGLLHENHMGVES